MSASFLFLSAAVALGADPATPPAPTALPAAPITVTATGCGGCGAPAATWSSCDPCAPKAGLFDRLRASWAARPKLFGNKSSSCCEPAPACAPAPVCAPAPAPACASSQPVFTGFTTSCNDPCQKVGLLDKLRAKFQGSRSCDACSAPQASACCGSSVANFPAVGAPVTPPPDKMPVPSPMPVDPKKDAPKKDVSFEAPVVEAPRVPTLGGTSGKY